MMLTIAFHFSCTSLEDGDTFYGCIEGSCKMFSGVSSSSEEISSSSEEFVEPECETRSDYDPETEFCQEGSNKILLLCDGQEYTTAEQCCNERIITEATQFCSKILKCGGFDYEPSTQFCRGSTVYEKCGGALEYNPATQFCCDGVICSNEEQ
jgi:hypothetical protein